LGFHTVTVVGELVKKIKKQLYKKEKQYTKQYKNTEYTKLKTNMQNKKKHTKNIKIVCRVIRK